MYPIGPAMLLMNSPDRPVRTTHRAIRFGACVGILLAQAFHLAAHAEDSIRLIAAGTHRAIVEVDNERHVLTFLEPDQNGISLVSSSTGEVVIRVDGELVRLDMFSGPEHVFLETDSAAGRADDSAVLWMSGDGFLYADGSINGKLTRFKVDTGATNVVLSGNEADRLGINWSRGRKGYGSTAGGIVPTRSFVADEITIQGITLRHVPASVIPGSFPVTPLLGGTFLNRLNMTRTGLRMDLSLP